ncbi:MAG TPA: hypothetical protein PKX92_05800 [Edaphocola sp.]|nr:hypothetical protein [Edaphocola sp.]
MAFLKKDAILILKKIIKNKESLPIIRLINMRKSLIIILIAFMSLAVNAQIFKGTIRNASDFELVEGAMIKDLNTGDYVWTNKKGYFEIRTKLNNNIVISKESFQSKNINIGSQQLQSSQIILLNLNENLLEEVIITGKTKYQIDSINRRELYKTPLSQPKEKAEFVITPTSLMIANPISSWLQYLVPRTRKTFLFQKRFKQWEDEKYIATKYSLEKVAKITLLEGDALANFRNAYPLTIENARTINEIALEQWILNNFKEWQSKSSVEKLELISTQLKN